MQELEVSSYLILKEEKRFRVLRIIINNKLIKLGEVKEEMNHLKNILEQTQRKLTEQKPFMQILPEKSSKNK